MPTRTHRRRISLATVEQMLDTERQRYTRLEAEVAALRAERQSDLDQRLTRIEANTSPMARNLGRRHFLAGGLGALVLGAGATLAGRGLSAQAATPTTINYQGRLTDAAGNPLNGSFAMQFNLYAAATGGSPVWTETRNGGNVVPVNNGLFSVFLGSITAIPTSILNQQLWLGVTVGADPEMTPREQLGTTAFTRTLDGYPASTSGAANSIPVLDGSGHLISSALADQSVTSRKLNRNFYNTSLGSNVNSPTAGSFTTILSLGSVVVDVDNTPVTVRAQIAGNYVGSAYSFSSRILFNNTYNVVDQYTYGAASNQTVYPHLSRTILFSAGTYSFQLQVSPGGGGYIFYSGASTCYMDVIVG